MFSHKFALKNQDMMRFILVSVLCIQLAWCYGNQQPNGAGAFAFSDSSGNRYGGTYGLKDGEVVDVKGDFPPDLPVNYLYPDFDSFYPYYFRNLENILQEVFEYNLEKQRQALDAAKKAHDLTSNQAGYIQNYQYRFGTPEYPGFPQFNGFDPYHQEMFGSGPWMPTYSQNSAFAGAAVGPGFTHQIAAINPPNPNNPNVNKVEHYSANAGPRGFMSVSSSSFASSSTVNGKTLSRKGAETVVNNNGKVTKYKVEN